MLTVRLKQLNSRLRRFESLSQRLKQASRSLSIWRLSLFFVGLICTAITFDLSGWASLAVALLFTLGFAYFVKCHQQIRQQQRFCKQVLKSVQADLARLHLDWTGIPELPLTEARKNHPYEIDLDLTGPMSLLRLIQTCFTVEGAERLKDWLLEIDPELNLLPLRQARVAALRPLYAFRQRLHLLVQESALGLTQVAGLWRSSEVLNLLETESECRLSKPLLLLTVMAVLNGVLYGATRLGYLPDLSWQISLGAYVLIYWTQRQHFSKLFQEAQSLQFGLGRLLPVLETLERQVPFLPASLHDLLAPFAGTHKPSLLLRKLSRVVAAASLQANPLVWVAANLVLPWDLFFAWRLERIKPEFRQHLPAWLDCIWELEALNSLAHFAWLRPHYIFPEQRGAGLACIDLGHPLLPESQKVRNSFVIEQAGDAFLITGSNMAGKSTFLKSLGVNLVLAQCGSVVDAQSFAAAPMRLFACIKVSDSVTDGLSYFYAEVRRLKALLNAIQAEHDWPVFYLIDEIFKGTNNRERLLGSRAYIESLLQQPALGGVTTHDLELVTLSDDHPRLTNYHFREFIQDQQMVFDYTLRTGPCPTTNALKIMALEGLPVPSEFVE